MQARVGVWSSLRKTWDDTCRMHTDDVHLHSAWGYVPIQYVLVTIAMCEVKVGTPSPLLMPTDFLSVVVHLYIRRLLSSGDISDL
jgi:hypothetical protein